MKIPTLIKYEVPYLPPRCRKQRYEEREESINVNLREVPADALQLAFEDVSYEGKGKIFLYNHKLWVKRKPEVVEGKSYTPLEWLKNCREKGSCYFRTEFDRIYHGMDTSREAVVKQARKDMQGLILVDGDLYEQTPEPRYVVMTFGLGYNHGGTSLCVTYHYNPNLAKSAYFSALQDKEAVARAKEVAATRGDTESIPRIKAELIVHMPELVRVKPNKQHGNGNPLLNDFEEIIRGSGDSLTAGLLCIARAQNNNKGEQNE